MHFLIATGTLTVICFTPLDFIHLITKGNLDRQILPYTVVNFARFRMVLRMMWCLLYLKFNLIFSFMVDVIFFIFNPKFNHNMFPFYVVLEYENNKKES
jgi:hypothetical protein